MSASVIMRVTSVHVESVESVVGVVGAAGRVVAPVTDGRRQAGGQTRGVGSGGGSGGGGRAAWVRHWSAPAPDCRCGSSARRS